MMDFINNSTNPEEDWGCVGPDELFFSSGSTPSLRSLMEKFEKGKNTDMMLKHVTSEFSLLDSGLPRKSEEFPEEQKIRDSDIADQQILTDEHKSPKGILKKGATGDDFQLKNTDLKSVSFEIERFVAANIADKNERLNAQQNLVMKLGARPPRKKGINYKQLKQQRLEEKKREGGAETNILNQLLHGVNKGKVKKSKSRKRWNRSGTLKKRTKK